MPQGTGTRLRSEPRTQRVFERSKRPNHRLLRCAACAAQTLLLLGGLSGCRGNGLFSDSSLSGITEPDSYVLQRNGFVADNTPIPKETADKLNEARELFRRKEYDKAEQIFHVLADNEKTPPRVAQEAMFHEAECLRLQGNFPRACDCYHHLVDKYAFTIYRDQAIRHMFEIANYWLNDTRAELAERREKREGKRWFVWPRFISFDKTKPLLDREGRAVDALENVYQADVRGELAAPAIFTAGLVQLENQNYREADHYFSLVPRKPPNPWADKADEYQIYCKNMATGGSDYDGRQAAAARKLAQHMLMNTPNLDPEKRKKLERQLMCINLQQAEKDYNMAAFYQRTGHPGSAYFYYEIVRRRYPNTRFAKQAGVEMNKLRAEMEKTQGGAPSPPAPPATPGPQPQAPQAPGGTAPSEAAPAPRPLPPGMR